jgi:LmbE family N-acetylglucosaminyl deacetylase
MTHRSKERALAIAAHADDETLGAGGTLAEHAAADAELCLLILSTSAVSRPDADHSTVDTHRRECAAKAAGLYGARLHIGDLPDNRFDTRPLLEITQRIEEVIRDFRPTIVYTHSNTDLSRDHQLVAQATAAATRPTPGSCVRTVLAYEVRSATDWGITETFRPTWYQLLTAAAVMMYSQLNLGSAQLTNRGTQFGAEAAEAFELIRHIG